MNVERYEHIDDYRCFSPLEMIIPHDDYDREDYPALDQIKIHLEGLFKKAGWEGDGDIECLFIAPCFYRNSDSYCETVFHVKQENNGTSWLAIPSYLELKLPNDF